MTTGAHLATAGGSWRAERPFLGGLRMIAGWLDAVGGVGTSAPRAVSAGTGFQADREPATSHHDQVVDRQNAENEDCTRFDREHET